MPIEYLCLECDHRWDAYKSRDEIKKFARQCPHCWSYEVMPTASYWRIVDLVRHGNPGPWIDAFFGVLQEEGLRLKPLKTWRLIQRILRDAGV